MNGTANKNPVSQRNHGIDLLRLVSAFYVIVLHTLYQGGVSDGVVPYSYQDSICRAMLVFSFCAVNIFGIISGYVGYRDTVKPASLAGYLSLWLSVVFYSVTICTVYMFLLPGGVPLRDWISMFFPLTRNLYWYFSAYTLVYFLAPYLNRFVHQTSAASLRKCFYLICFVIVPLEYLKRDFGMCDGYSAMWLLILYLVGAIMKKTQIGSRIPAIAVVFMILAVTVSFFYLNLKVSGIRFLIFDLSFEINHSYITPFYLCAAVFHVLLFSKFKFHPFVNKLIGFAAPAAFFVYIVNVQEQVWAYFMKDRFVSWASGSPAGILIRTVGFSLAFVAAVVILDYFRRQLFRLLGVPKLLNRIAGKQRKEQLL